jgi:hypothetical protein
MGIEPGALADAARREVEEARDRLSAAAGLVRHEALSAGSAISALVLDELDRRGGDLGDGLHNIADKMRGAAGKGDGGPPRMIRQAVDVIDDLSQRLLQPSARDLRGKVARFGQDNPATFMAACLVAGMVTGRLLIAQGGGTGPVADTYGPSDGDGQSGGRGTAPAAGADGAARSDPDCLPSDDACDPVRGVRNG